jgi:hypothetical protein
MELTIAELSGRVYSVQQQANLVAKGSEQLATATKLWLDYQSRLRMAGL